MIVETAIAADRILEDVSNMDIGPRGILEVNAVDDIVILEGHEHIVFTDAGEDRSRSVGGADRDRIAFGSGIQGQIPVPVIKPVGENHRVPRFDEIIHKAEGAIRMGHHHQDEGQ